MQIVYDRYAPQRGSRHVDLATGRLVEILTRDVPDDDWRRRWRRRVSALLAPCPALEALVDAGEWGPHHVFEVRGVVPRRAERPVDAAAAAEAAAWLRAHRLSAGSCRRSRVLPDGRLCADGQTAWPVETRAEQAAAQRTWRAWMRLGRKPCEYRHEAVPTPVAFEELEEWDARTGLIELAMPAPDALRFARATGRIAIGRDVDPAVSPPDFRAGRSFVIMEADRPLAARWAAMLAAAAPSLLSSGRRASSDCSRARGCLHSG